MAKTNFIQKHKLAVLKSAKRTTVKDAAVVSGVHFSTVYDWRKQLETMVKRRFLHIRYPIQAAMLNTSVKKKNRQY